MLHSIHSPIINGFIIIIKSLFGIGSSIGNDINLNQQYSMKLCAIKLSLLLDELFLTNRKDSSRSGFLMNDEYVKSNPAVALAIILMMNLFPPEL